jgi:transposase
VSTNVTLAPLPPYSPELNPVKRVRLYLRERNLSPGLLDDYDAIVDAAAPPEPIQERLRSLTNYSYLQRVTG